MMTALIEDVVSPEQLAFLHEERKLARERFVTTRRRFVIGLAVVVGGALFGVRSAHAEAYRLRPTSDCRCSACRKHAENKTFASAQSIVRAHPHCRCAIEKVALSPEVHAKMFSAAAIHDRRQVVA